MIMGKRKGMRSKDKSFLRNLDEKIANSIIGILTI